MAAPRSRMLPCLVLGFGLALATLGFQGAFCGTVAPLRSRQVLLQAEAEAANPKKSVALVKVTEENAVTTASVLGGAVGLLTGGVWVGAALFAASSYISRKDDDLSMALKGVSSTALEALNFGAYLNDKYEVTGKVGETFSRALESSPDAKKSVDDAWGQISEAYASVEKDVGVKDTFGTILASGSELASQAVNKAIELNEQYKITDQISERISEAVESAQSSTAKKA